MEKSKQNKFKRATAKGRLPPLNQPFQSAPGTLEGPVKCQAQLASVSDAPPRASAGSPMPPGILGVTILRRLRRREACALGGAPC